MRVKLKTKNRGGKQESYSCSRCTDPIEPGQRYFEWCFYRQRPTRQHQSHGSPRQSQLTQSKLGEVYSAIEAIEDLFAGEWEPEDARNMLDELISTVDEMAAEYEQAAEPFGGQGEHAERAEELESFSSSLGNVEIDEEPGENESVEDFKARIQEEVESAIGEAP